MCGIFYPFALQVKALRLQSKLPEKMHFYKLLLCDKFRKITVGERRSNVNPGSRDFWSQTAWFCPVAKSSFLKKISATQVTV